MNDSQTDFNKIDRLKQLFHQLEDHEIPQNSRLILSQILTSVEDLYTELESTQSEAMLAKDEKTKFVSVVTHELRIPLTSIKGYTDLMLQEIVGEVNNQQKEFLNVIRNNVGRMTALISDLSDMSHIQTGRLTLQPKLVELSEFLEQVLRSWQPKFLEKDQIFKVIKPELEPKITVDPGRVRQVIDNLLSNAHNYTASEGQISLQIDVKTGSLHIKVEDNGIGISEKDVGRLFTPFFRSEDSKIREVPGWGLGLYVSKLLIDLMGGELVVESQYQKGSKFSFTIPQSNNL